MDALDLAELDVLCEMAVCVTLDNYRQREPRKHLIGLRHDVDDKGWESTLAMARWEYGKGRRSTFYFLHTAPYWGPWMDTTLREILDLGHEVGLHNNAVAEWWRTGQSPFACLERAAADLRKWSGSDVRTTCGHGDGDCYTGNFLNYLIFEEFIGKGGVGWTEFEELTGLAPRPLEAFGFEYAAELMPRGAYLSDSGNLWNVHPMDMAMGMPYDEGLVILQHPDHYDAELFLA